MFYSTYLQMPVALKGVFDCLKVWKAMWRRVTVEGGMECVDILGTTRMPLWCAENWDILQQVPLQLEEWGGGGGGGGVRGGRGKGGQCSISTLY